MLQRAVRSAILSDVRIVVGGLIAVALVCAGAAARADAARASRGPIRPQLSAVFTATSYAPGQLARLRIRGPERRLELQILRAGAERAWSSVGRPWGPPRRLTLGRGKVRTVRVRMGAWSSGLYFARLTAPNGRAVVYAPFVLRPGVPGRNRVAIVLPTYSWQAYNFFDANGDGKPDSWYPDPHRHDVLLGRPFAGSGKPPHYRTQQRGFLRFLVHTRQAGRLPDRRGPRAPRERRRARGPLRPDRLLRATRSTSRRTSTT